MCPNELVSSITALAVCIAENRTENEVLLLSSVFMQLGDTLATLAASRAVCCENEKKG